MLVQWEEKEGGGNMTTPTFFYRKDVINISIRSKHKEEGTYSTSCIVQYVMYPHNMCDILVDLVHKGSVI